VKIVFLGNFEPVHSTESHHKLTWEKLGHQVIALQENKITTDVVVEACKDAQLFQWTHTHGFVTSGTILLTEMLDRIHQLGVKSFSYHLDVYWGLNQWDKREANIGKHPSWRVQHFFSTDGSHDADFKRCRVNHHWLPPGVVETGCFEGSFQPSLACEVGFIGSVNYHPEAPFRGIMVKALQDRYGHRFRTFQGVRERALNDLYASVKVAVGDHCFSGRPRYWSDRAPETCGRGGFIVYPLVEGFTIPTATYIPQCLPDLFKKVDYYLDHPEKREVIRKRCFEHVKKFDTYTVRLQEILRVMGL
jgi:hypothetical protein